MTDKHRTFRALIIILSIVCIYVILVNSAQLVEFYNLHGIHNVDFKLIMYIILGVVAFLSGVTLLIVNVINRKKNLSLINVSTAIAVIIFCIWIEIQPLNYNKYRQVFEPMTFSRLNKISKMKYGANADIIVYVYRSDCEACKVTTPKLKQFLLKNEYDIYSFDLTKIREKMDPVKYAKFVKRLGVYEVPTVVVFSSPDKYHKRNYRSTFNGIANEKPFKKMSDFLLH